MEGAGRHESFGRGGFLAVRDERSSRHDGRPGPRGATGRHGHAPTRNPPSHLEIPERELFLAL